MGPGDLAQALSSIAPQRDPRVLVGMETSDDAGVFLLDEATALVQTLDFITPVVDDPYAFGRIAAANSLSDVFAMGGKPLTAMNIVCFPCCELPMDTLNQILRGGAEAVAQAGAVLIGGHSVDDLELKYGLSVTGVVDPRRVVSNAGAEPGDLLVLTKPLGVGFVTTAIKGGMASDDAAGKAIESMSALNAESSQAMLGAGAHACTDVTGFGLAGHALEIARASRVSLEIWLEKLPVVHPHALDYANMGLVAAATYRNREFVSSLVEGGDGHPLELLLYDPQTSGGLLVSLPEQSAHLVPGEVVGRVVEGPPLLRVKAGP